MTPNQHDTQAQLNCQAVQDLLHNVLRERMLAAIRTVFVDLLDEEVAAFLGAGPYQRTPQRQSRRSGYYTRDLTTSVGTLKDLSVPRTRNGFKTRLFESYQRRMAELDQMIGQMFIAGLSQTAVGQVVKGLTGTAPSASTVSRVFHGLADEFAAWKQRSLPARYAYVYGDGTYFTVMYEQDGQAQGHKTPVLALIGITPEGRCELIAFTVGERENRQAWEGLFEDIRSRGVQEIGLWVSDGHQAMLNALEAKFPGVCRQRCIKHKMDNILAYVPEKNRQAVRLELRAIFYQDNRTQAEQTAAAFKEKYRAVYPSAIDCLQRDWEACLTFYEFPKSHWRRIRTSNVIERMFEEVKKRSKKMSAPFRNEESCLLLFYAVTRSLKFQNVVMPSAPG